MPKKNIILSACFLFLCVPFVFLRAEELISWTDCLEETRKNNPDLIAAQENINQQKAAKDITASALYPQVDAAMSAATAKSSGVTSDSYAYGLSGTQLIFDGFKTLNNVHSAAENIEVARQGWRFTSSEVRLNLRTAFVDLLTAQELLKVTQEIIKIRRDNMELISLQYYSGLEHKGALLTAEANLAAAEFDYAQAERALESAQTQLDRQMGRSEFKPLMVKGDFIVNIEQEKPDFEKILRNNPSLLQAVAKKNLAAYDLKSAYGGFAPTFSGSAGANKGGSKWPPDDDRWNLGLSLSMPVFEGGLQFAQVSKAKAAYRQTIYDEKVAKYSAIVSLEQAWNALQDALGTVDVQRKNLEATEERSKIAQAQYSTGFITFDNWIIIEDNLVSAKRSYLQSQANALLAEASWIQAKGETLEYAQ